MLPCSDETLKDKDLEILEHITILTTHDLEIRTGFISSQLSTLLYVCKPIAQLLSKLITSTNSGVSLKGELSKPRFFGEHDKMNP